MILAPEQSYQLDYATCDYKEGVTGFSAKLLLSVRSWREKLRRCFIRISRLFVARAMESEVRPTLVTYARAPTFKFQAYKISFGWGCPSPGKVDG